MKEIEKEGMPRGRATCRNMRSFQPRTYAFNDNVARNSGKRMNLACRLTWQYWTRVREIILQVGPLITKHVPIIKHFRIFSSFLNQIERFLSHWMRKLEGCKCSLSVIRKGATQKTQEEDELYS